MSTKQATTLSSIFESGAFAWLDKVAEPLQNGAQKAFGAGSGGMKLKSLLNGTPIRHRVHPALIIWPLGAWTTAALLDALENRVANDKRPGYRASADASVAFGVVGALPTAIAGVADWVDLGDHPRRVGMAHAVANSFALSCYVASMALRVTGKESRRGTAKALAALGYTAVSLGGALGGELVYNLGFNVPQTLYPKPPDDERDVLASADLPDDTPVTVQLDWVPVLLYRTNGEVFAVQHWCPHAGGPLADGTFEGDTVQCPWHGSRFCLRDGAPTQGPASYPLKTFTVREHNGRIFIKASYESQSWPHPPKPPVEEVDYAVSNQ